MRRGDSIPTKWLSAGSALLLVCGMASAQTQPTPATGVTAKSGARLQTLSAPATSHNYRNRRLRKSAANGRRHGQQKIDPVRSREIQEALVREHYLDGTASGVWDAKSESAMERFQADNGWQSKSVPDSRALIKLGLGPDHEHLLNPESAMTSQPEPLHAAPMFSQTRGVGNQPQK